MTQPHPKERLPDALHETVQASSGARAEQVQDGRPGRVVLVGLVCVEAED